MREYRRTLRARTAVGAAVVAGLAAGMAQAQVQCDLLFREVAESAPIVAVVEVDSSHRDSKDLRLVEILRGDPGLVAARIPAAPVREKIGPRGLRPGDRMLVALDRVLIPLQWVQGMGFCTAVSVLRLADSGLRPAERAAYDGRREALALAEIRADLGEPQIGGVTVTTGSRVASR